MQVCGKKTAHNRLGAGTHSMLKDISKILVSDAQIRERIAELGKEITSYYHARGIEEISLVCITNGSIVFVADLMREIGLHLRLDCIRVSSYQNEMSPITEPEIIDQIRLDLKGRHTLLIDDILDTGATLSKIVKILKRMGPASLRTCVLLDKEGRRTKHFTPEYRGFSIPDEFVVGYGLDFAELYRNLPFIGVLKAEQQNPPVWQ